MPIAMVRIDDRLIHGQVTVAWTRGLKANRILVVDDRAAGDKTQRMLLQMATPKGMEVSILGADEAGLRLAAGDFAGDRLLILAKGPREVVKLVRAGVKIGTVNVGNMQYSPGRRQIWVSISVGPDDVAAFNELTAAGVDLVAQRMPDDRRAELKDLLK